MTYFMSKALQFALQGNSFQCEWIVYFSVPYIKKLLNQTNANPVGD